MAISEDIVTEIRGMIQCTAVDTLLPEYCDTLLTRPIRFLRLCTTRVNYASIRLGSHLASAGAENFYSIRAVFSKAVITAGVR